MEELIIAINEVAEGVKHQFGFEELIPIAISIVSLYISLMTLLMQKKLDLFDKRYDVYYQVKEIIKFKDEILKLKSIPFQSEYGINYDFANMYFALWIGKNLKLNNELNSVNSKDIVRQISIVNVRRNEELKSLDKLDLLYYLEEKEILKEFSKAYGEFIDSMVIVAYNLNNQIDIFEVRDKFIEKAEMFENNILRKLREVIDISNMKPMSLKSSKKKYNK